MDYLNKSENVPLLDSKGIYGQTLFNKEQQLYLQLWEAGLMCSFQES